MKRPRLVAGAIALTLLTGCGTVPQPSPAPVPSETARDVPSATASAVPDAWEALFRPLQLPTLEPGADCPTTTSAVDVEGIGPLLGDGPIYPAFAGPEGIFSLGIDDPVTEPVEIDGQEWWGKKTLWVSNDTYRGIALVRGGRIDRDGEVRFYPGSGPDYVRAMRLTEEPWVRGPSTPAGWREWNSGVFFTQPGCYAYQIDGEGFTAIVVVEATAGS